MATGMRIAFSTLLLAAFAALCLFIAFIPDSGVGAFFGSLAAIYGASVVALSLKWFWARWFARGIGMWGTFAGLFLMLQTGFGLVLIVFTAGHAAVTLLLMGDPIAARYDGRSEWRERWQLDDRNAGRIADLVTNLGALLPWVAFYAFFPRMGGAAAIVAAVLVGAGLVGVVRMRTWGVLAVAGAAATMFGVAMTSCSWGAPLLAALLLVAVAPFARPVVRFMREPRV